MFLVTVVSSCSDSPWGIEAFDGLTADQIQADASSQMLFNWYTIDACFMSSSWHITTAGQFAGSCIGVVLLSITLQLLRLASNKYDGYLRRKFLESRMQTRSPQVGPRGSGAGSEDTELATKDAACPCPRTTAAQNLKALPEREIFRKSFLQSQVKAALFAAQLFIAYFLMMLAMYYNGECPKRHLGVEPVPIKRSVSAEERQFSVIRANN